MDDELSIEKRIERLMQDFTEEEMAEIDFMFANGMASDAGRVMGLKIEPPKADAPIIEEPPQAEEPVVDEEEPQA